MSLPIKPQIWISSRDGLDTAVSKGRRRVPLLPRGRNRTSWHFSWPEWLEAICRFHLCLSV